MRGTIITGAVAAAALAGAAFGLSLAGATSPAPISSAAGGTFGAHASPQAVSVGPPPTSTTTTSAPTPPSQPAATTSPAPAQASQAPTTGAAATTTPSTAPAPVAASAPAAPSEPAQPPAADASQLAPGQCAIAVNANQENPLTGTYQVLETTYDGDCATANELAAMYPGAIVVTAPASTEPGCSTTGTCVGAGMGDTGAGQ